MLDIISIEYTKNTRAVQRIVGVIYILLIAIILLALWRYCRDGCIHADLIKFMEVTLPCFTFIIARPPNMKK